MTFPEGAPPDEARAPLLIAFGSQQDAAIWSEPEVAPKATPSRSEAAPGPREEPHHAGHAGALAALTVIAPMLIGLGIGRVARSLLGPRPAVVARVALTIVPVIAAALSLPAFARAGSWDVLAAGLLVGGSALAGSSRSRARDLARRLALAVVATALALGAVELVARRLPAPRAVFPSPDAARLLFDETPGIEACAPFYPASTPGPLLDRTRAIRAGLPTVIHLGDSMVEGVGVAPEQTFVARLGALRPGVNDVNA